MKLEGPLGAMLLASLLGAGDRAGAAEKPAARPVEQDVATLLAAADRYTGEFPFYVRQLVTPRDDSGLKGAGSPHIVLEINEEPRAHLQPGLHGKPNSADFGKRLDMRVASTCDCPHGEIIAHWVESWMFEPWAAPAADSPA